MYVVVIICAVLAETTKSYNISPLSLHNYVTDKMATAAIVFYTTFLEILATTYGTDHIYGPGTLII